MRMTIYLFYLLFGYLSGSVLYSYLIPKHFCHVDVRTANEDQNPGAFNAFSAAGPRVGLLCVLCDIGKGFLPVFLAVHSSAVSMGSWLFALILLAPVAGHAWPFLQPAKGGKAISVSFGVLLGLLPDLRPALLLAAFYLTFSLILIIQPHNLRSIASFAASLPPRRFPAFCRPYGSEVCSCHWSSATATFSASDGMNPKMFHLQFSLCLLK